MRLSEFLQHFGEEKQQDIMRLLNIQFIDSMEECPIRAESVIGETYSFSFKEGYKYIDELNKEVPKANVVRALEEYTDGAKKLGLTVQGPYALAYTKYYVEHDMELTSLISTLGHINWARVCEGRN